MVADVVVVDMGGQNGPDGEALGLQSRLDFVPLVGKAGVHEHHLAVPQLVEGDVHTAGDDTIGIAVNLSDGRHSLPPYCFETPKLSSAIWRRRNFWTLPVEVQGQSPSRI